MDDAVHASADASLLHDAAFLGALRAQMLQFAILQLGDAHLAEDAVQEAFAGALRNAAAFTRRAAVRTWVFAILKHKIADALRQKQRYVDADTLLGARDAAEDLRELFDADGHWDADTRPRSWNAPHEAFREQQFWRVFELCLERLPAQQARVFMMREFIGLETAEICAAAALSVSNLNVLLHRARLRLRECLEGRWFAAGERP